MRVFFVVLVLFLVLVFSVTFSHASTPIKKEHVDAYMEQEKQLQLYSGELQRVYALITVVKEKQEKIKMEILWSSGLSFEDSINCEINFKDNVVFCPE